MNVLDRALDSMMRKFGTQATISVAIDSAYDPDSSENVVTYQDYAVNVMFFDYIRKEDGLGTERNTLIQTGDKQVYMQPPQKTSLGLPLPHVLPNRDFLTFGDTTYKIILLKQLNPSMSQDGCTMYELYVRE